MSICKSSIFIQNNKMTIFKNTFQINPDLRKPISMLKSIFNLIDWKTCNTYINNNTFILHKKIKSISN